MRASRLLSILLILQTRGRMTAQALADELEVSVRTVYRDVESLGMAGVPVYADRGPAGGYQLLDGYRTRLTGLTRDEAESLFLAGMPGPAAELGLGSVLAAAQLKLLAAMPPELRDRAGRIRERFHLDAPRWFQDAEQTPHLAAVADAVWHQHPVRVRYRRWTAPRDVTRTLEPLGVVLKAGVWYVVARAVEQSSTSDASDVSDAARQIRTYRVSHVLDLEILSDDHFERPVDFDLASFWQSWSRHFEASVYHGEAVVRLAPRLLDRLAFLVSPVVAKAASETAGPPDAEGWVQATLPIESIHHAAADLLRLGADVEVLAPPELRERMTATAAALAALYHS